MMGTFQISPRTFKRKRCYVNYLPGTRNYLVEGLLINAETGRYFRSSTILTFHLLPIKYARRNL
jgi:hypothetical protein